MDEDRPNWISLGERTARLTFLSSERRWNGARTQRQSVLQCQMRDPRMRNLRKILIVNTPGMRHASLSQIRHASDAVKGEAVQLRAVGTVPVTEPVVVQDVFCDGFAEIDIQPDFARLTFRAERSLFTGYEPRTTECVVVARLVVPASAIEHMIEQLAKAYRGGDNVRMLYP